MTLKSPKSKRIVKRVPKDADHEHGIIDAENIPVDEPCIVAIGGERTISRRHANYYASILNRLLSAYKIDDIGIYSAYYNFKNTDRESERAQLFRVAQSRLEQRVGMSPMARNKYIRDLYRHIIFPRIVTSDNKRFSDADATQNMRRIMIFTHCHGAAIVRAFQEMTISDMRKYGYDDKGIAQIMHGLLVVQHAPAAPIKNSLFNTVSFMSANDTRMNFHDAFSQYLSEHDEDLMPSYFRSSNLFAAYRLTNTFHNEHQIIGLVPNEDTDIMTPDGAIIMAAERNTIINGVKSMANPNKKPLSVRELIAAASPDDIVRPDFNELKSSGDFFMYVMRNDLRKNRLKTR